MNLYPDESIRQRLFPVCRTKIFLAHAAVTALPGPVADAMVDYTRMAAENPQEFDEVLAVMKDTRRVCAEFVGCRAEEVALLGPTSLGLSLFANGLDWQPGDEVVCYADDYPANVYPWLELRRRGVTVRYVETETPGLIEPAHVERALTSKTRLVALASAHFLTGRRLDVDAMGAMLRERGVLFSVDGIQTVGAMPFSMREVDFMSADAHKWLLGPCAIGIVAVKREHFERLRPTLLGAWNIWSPQFIAQEEIRFMPTAQRYEPGVLNLAGVYGLRAAVQLIAGHGIETVSTRILELKSHLVARLDELGFEVVGARSGPGATGSTTFTHPRRDAAGHEAFFAALNAAQVVSSLRHDRSGRALLRFSPHFYNTEAELDVACDVLRKTLG